MLRTSRRSRLSENFLFYFQSFPLHLLTREECNNLLKSLGFYNYKDVVPERHESGPYVRDETEMAKLYALIEEKEQEEAETLQREKEEAERKEQEEAGKEEETETKDKEQEEKVEDAEETDNLGERAHEENKYLGKENKPVKGDL